VSLTADILTLRTVHLEFNAYFNNLCNDLTYAAQQCDAESWAGLAQQFRNMQVHTLEIRDKYMGATPSLRNTMYAILHYIDENLNGAAEVDMDSILSAMITADFDQLQKFIGLVDAYRVAIWNAPFNAEFYGALARGFQTWP